MKATRTTIRAVILVIMSTVIAHAGACAEGVEWKLIGPGTRGTMRGPAFHPTNPRIFSIGIDMGLHFMTRDGGITWEIFGKRVSSKYKFTGYPGYRGAHATVFDPKNPDIIWSGGTDGLYKSKDGGESWEFVMGGDASYFIGNIEVDPTDPNIVYVGSGDPGAGYFQKWVNGSVIYKTVDGGQSWKPITPLAEKRKRGNVWARIVIDPNSSFIAGAGHKRVFALRHPQSKTPGLIVSNDYGQNWERVNTQIKGILESPNFNYLTLVSDHGKTILFASMLPTQRGNRRYGGIFRSDDLGKTWVETIKGLEGALSSARRTQLIKIASTPADPKVLYVVANGRVFKSRDQGESWQEILHKTGQWHNDIPDFDGKYAEYLLQTGDGNMEWSNRGILGGFHSIVVAPGSADHVIVTGKSGALITTNGGRTWSELGFTYSGKSSSYPLAMRKFGRMTVPSTFTYRRTARQNFQAVVPSDVAVDPFNSNNIAVAYGDEGLQISRDSGVSWEWSYWGVLFREATDARVVVYDPEVKNRIFLGTMGKVDLERLGEKEIWKLYRSDDAGVTFKSIGPDFMPSHRLVKEHVKEYTNTRGSMITLGVKDILIDRTTPPGKRAIYIAYSTGIYKTVNGGETWSGQLHFNAEKIKDVSNDKYYLKLEMNPRNHLEIYLGSYEGLYRSENGGKVWTKVAPELFGAIKSLSWSTSDPSVIYVVATQGEGNVDQSDGSHVWKSTNAGRTWKRIDEQQTQFVTVHPKDSNIVYRALYARDVRYEDTGLFRSKDGGETWEKINPHLPMSFKGGFKHKGRIVFDPRNNQHLYVVTWCGVYEGWDREVPR